MVEKGIRKWIITFTVITAALLELIDTTIVNVSIPQIMGNLGATLDEVGWVVTAYAVANVIILPMSGWLGNKFGRKNYFLFSIIMFTTISFFCGHATSLNELIAFRILQGLAGGGLLSTAQAILLDSWPPEEVGIATALFGLGAVFGPTVGPTIGGFITDHFSWPWIFYVNIPVGAIAAFLVVTFVRETPKYDKGKPVDWWGIILLATAVGSLQTVLERGEAEDWFSKTYISVLAVVVILAGLGFIWREVSTDHPVVDFKILRYRNFTIGIFTSFMLGFALYGSVFVFPIMCQNLLGFSAEQTGELLFPGGMATIFMMPFIGLMLKKGFPPAQVLATFGMILFFVFSSMMSHSTLSSGVTDFFWPLIIRGIGMAFLFVPLTTLAIQDLRGKDIGQGTGLNNMMRQLGGSFGIAIITTLISIRNGFHRVMLIQNINPYNNAFIQRKNLMIHGFMGKGYSLLDANKMAMAAMEGTVIKQTYLLSYTDVFYLVGIFMICTIPLLYFQKFKKGPKMLPVDAH
ncbi:MAG: DHA2 family efflux MFS transporter permease subunit [Chitinophagaceae bacterium]